MSTKIKTGKVRFGYVNVFEPRATGDEKEPKYSTMIIIDKDDKETLNAIKSAVEAAKLVGKEKVPGWKGRIPSELRLPVRNGDDKPDNEELQGKYFLNAKASINNKPQVVKKEGGRLVLVTDPAEFQSGDYGKASLSLYPYSVNGNNGIGVGLNNIFFMEKGESLVGATSALTDFADEADETEEEDWM